MRWPDSKGKLKWHSDSKYRIDWDRKAPSKGAQEVKNFLKKHCFNQVLYEEYRLPHCLLRIDFINATKKFAIEFNGKQHKDYVKYFHGNQFGWLKQIQTDIKKREFLERAGFTVIEIEDTDFPLTKEFFKNFGVII